MFITLTNWNNVRLVVRPEEIEALCVNKEAEVSPAKSFVYMKGGGECHHVRETLDEVLAMIPVLD